MTDDLTENTDTGSEPDSDVDTDAGSPCARASPDWNPVQTVCSKTTRNQGGFTYEYWKDTGTGCMELGLNGAFYIDWTNINNLLARKGLRPGSTDLEVSYPADYRPNGNS